MASVSGFAVPVKSTRAGRVGDAELVRMKKEGICVRDIKMLFFSHEASPLA